MRSKKQQKRPERKMSVSCRNRTKSEASTISYFSSAEISALMSVFDRAEKKTLDKLARSPHGHSRYGAHLIKIKQRRLMFRMGLEIGPRVSEIIGIRWEDLDADRLIVTVWDEKKDVHRFCTMPDGLWEELAAYRGMVDRRQGLLFPITDKTANRWLKELAEAAGIKRRVWWHMMRHTHVVQSRRAGRDWDWISQQTGDSVATLIKWYSKLSIEDRHEIGNSTSLVGRRFGPWEE